MFLTPDDYKYLIKEDILSRIVSHDMSQVASAQMWAQELIESYLREKYDVAQVFNKTGEDRNALIMGIMMDLVIHKLHSRSNVEIPTARIQAYETAMEWLNKVSKPTQKGGISVDLPLVEVTPPDVEKTGFYVKSEARQVFDF